MKEVQWLSNGELYVETINNKDEDREPYLLAELERRLRLFGFLDMPLEFYLRELEKEFSLQYYTRRKQFECYSADLDMEFHGKTALEAAKAAYEWKNNQK